MASPEMPDHPADGDVFANGLKKPLNIRIPRALHPSHPFHGAAVERFADWTPFAFASRLAAFVYRHRPTSEQTAESPFIYPVPLFLGHKIVPSPFDSPALRAHSWPSATPSRMP